MSRASDLPPAARAVLERNPSLLNRAAQADDETVRAELAALSPSDLGALVSHVRAQHDAVSPEEEAAIRSIVGDKR